MIGRIAVIFLSFLVASAAAGVTIAIGLLGPDWPAVSGDIGERVGFWVLAFFAAGASGAIIILPLFLLVVLAESYRLRSVLLYAVVGAGAMLIGYGMVDLGDRLDARSFHFPLDREVTIAMAAGIVFGLVYWLLAGRKAGLWRVPRA
jgi:hypothetical protein